MATQRMDGVSASGVFGGSEAMEEDSSFVMDVGPTQGSQQAPQEVPGQDLPRMLQQQIAAEIQGGRLVPNSAGTPQQGGNPLLGNVRPGEPQPNITVNHTYNIHYQSDRPSHENQRDVETYGQELTTSINMAAIEKTRVDTVSPTNTLQEPNIMIEPPLEVVDFFRGRTGISDAAQYIPDGKYRSHFKRATQGEQIDLRQLHAPIGRNENQECRHVALIGNPGCGKTVLLKRYARMVLNREVPDLRDIEIVHFVDCRHIDDEDSRSTTCELLFERLVSVLTNYENVFKHGFHWLCQNAEKLLLIFDQADDIVTKFEGRARRINHRSKASLETIMNNILTDHLLQGCRTLIASRDFAWRDTRGDSRPQKFVIVKCMPDESKLQLIKSVCPGLQGEDFVNYLERRYPGAFALSDDVMHLYFALASLQYGCPDHSSVSTDCMLVIYCMENMLRSCNLSRSAVHKIPKVKRFAYNMIEKGKMRFTLFDIPKNEINPLDLSDFVVTAPSHKHSIFYRLLDSDYSFFFPHQTEQEVFAATYAGELPIQDFKKFVAEKMNTKKWLIVRRYLCALYFHSSTRQICMHYMKKMPDAEERKEVLRTSLKKMVSDMDRISEFECLELLITLYEAGPNVADLIKMIRRIILPSTKLDPSDVYALSRVFRHIDQIDEIEVCLGSKIDMKEFSTLVKDFVMKSAVSKIDMARIPLSKDHVEDIQVALSDKGETIRRARTRKLPVQQITIIVNQNSSELIAQDLQRLKRDFAQINVERVAVLEDDSAV